jgi:hypothetical protein
MITDLLSSRLGCWHAHEVSAHGQKGASKKSYNIGTGVSHSNSLSTPQSFSYLRPWGRALQLKYPLICSYSRRSTLLYYQPGEGVVLRSFHAASHIRVIIMSDFLTYTLVTIGNCQLHQLHLKEGKVCRYCWSEGC